MTATIKMTRARARRLREAKKWLLSLNLFEKFAQLDNDNALQNDDFTCGIDLQSGRNMLM